MVTAAIIYWGLRFLRFAVHIREVCVLTAPFFASNTTLVAYFFGKEIWDTGAGLVAAALIAICPGYISRSVAGSYDNEGVAIFALLLTFYLFVKAVNTGSLSWALASAFGYFYMVSAWGGYVFIINLLPLYVLVLLVTGRYSMRLYIAYNCMYVLGMLLAMQIRFVGFQHVQSGEHMAAMGVFFLIQVSFLLNFSYSFCNFISCNPSINIYSPSELPLDQTLVVVKSEIRKILFHHCLLVFMKIYDAWYRILFLVFSSFLVSLWVSYICFLDLGLAETSCVTF